MEILQIIKDIAEDKLLGIDGFTLKFFTSTREITEKQSVSTIKYFLTTFKISKNFKHTLIILIPKFKYHYDEWLSSYISLQHIL